MKTRKLAWFLLGMVLTGTMAGPSMGAIVLHHAGGDPSSILMRW